jgi:hypothetical protein
MDAVMNACPWDDGKVCSYLDKLLVYVAGTPVSTLAWLHRDTPGVLTRAFESVVGAPVVVPPSVVPVSLDLPADDGTDHSISKAFVRAVSVAHVQRCAGGGKWCRQCFSDTEADTRDSSFTFGNSSLPTVKSAATEWCSMEVGIPSLEIATALYQLSIRTKLSVHCFGRAYVDTCCGVWQDMIQRAPTVVPCVLAADGKRFDAVFVVTLGPSEAQSADVRGLLTSPSVIHVNAAPVCADDVALISEIDVAAMFRAAVPGPSKGLPPRYSILVPEVHTWSVTEFAAFLSGVRAVVAAGGRDRCMCVMLTGNDVVAPVVIRRGTAVASARDVPRVSLGMKWAGMRPWYGRIAATFPAKRLRVLEDITISDADRRQADAKAKRMAACCAGKVASGVLDATVVTVTANAAARIEMRRFIELIAALCALPVVRDAAFPLVPVTLSDKIVGQEWAGCREGVGAEEGDSDGECDDEDDRPLKRRCCAFWGQTETETGKCVSSRVLFIDYDTPWFSRSGGGAPVVIDVVSNAEKYSKCGIPGLDVSWVVFGDEDALEMTRRMVGPTRVVKPLRLSWVSDVLVVFMGAGVTPEVAWMGMRHVAQYLRATSIMVWLVETVAQTVDMFMYAEAHPGRDVTVLSTFCELAVCNSVLSSPIGCKCNKLDLL